MFLLILGNAAILGGLFWFVVARQHRSEARQKQLERDLDASAKEVEDLRAARDTDLATAQLAAIVESSEDAIIGKDLAGTITSWNGGAETIFGYSAAEMIGRSILQVIPPGRRDEEDEILARIRRGENVPHFDTVRTRGDGRAIAVSVTVSAIRDRNGKVVGASKVARDITDRKMVEDALRKSHEQLLSLVEQAPISIAMLDREMCYLIASRRWVADYGRGQRDLTGLSHYDVHPDLPERWKEVHRRGLAGDFLSNDEDTWLQADGNRIWLRWAVHPWRNPRGEIGGIIISTEDITSRKRAELALRESEERFRQMAENIDEVFWMTDVAKHEMLYVSPGFERIWGRRCDELRTAPQAWLEAVVPEDRGRVRSAVLTKQAEGDYREEYRIKRPDGTTRWILERAFPVRDEAGGLYRIVGVAEDITDRKKLEEQFLRAQRIEAVATLAGGLAHDLNNILAPVIMIAGLLRAKLPAARDQQTLEMMESSAQRGAAIIRQLLTFSRGISGERMNVQLAHLIKDMVSIMRETFPREITVRYKTPAEFPLILGDATQLHQVLMNLCVNARDAMPEGGTLTVSAGDVELSPAEARIHPEARAGRYVLLAVEDTGHGISPENLGRIFDPFFTTKEVGKGTGLGLATVLGIAKSHGGFVTVYSELLHGTTFKVYLPVAESVGESAVATDQAELGGGHGETILVVDDEVPISLATRLVLEQHHYRVLTAENGREAISTYLAHQDSVALVLTDVMMPVMGGVALAKELQGLKPGIKIIATTGLGQEAKLAHLTALGIRDVLLKPCSAEELLRTIRRRLDEG